MFVQSTDKNLMVPVGGAIIAGADKKLISDISASYPGRASAAPSTDMFITLLSMGVRGYKQLLNIRYTRPLIGDVFIKSFLLVRKQLFTSLIQQLEVVETKFPVRVLRSKNNTISVAISLEAGADQERAEGEESSRGAGAGQLTQIGSMLFTRGVSGTRVVTGQTLECSVLSCANQMSFIAK